MFGRTKLLLVILALPLLLGLLLVTPTASQAQSINKVKSPQPKIRLLLPRPGDTFTPGEKIKIAWDADIPPNLDLTWCEQEIFLSIDGGKTFQYRLTPELSPTVRFYEITVPNLPTDNAVLDIRFGSELSSNRFEKSKPQKQSKFRILRKTTSIEEIKLNLSAQNNLQPGDQINFNWNSSVSELSHYEVLISYDRGGHFHSIQQTNTESFTWTVPAEFSGLVTFKVVAHKLNGNKIESITDAQPIKVTRGL